MIARILARLRYHAELKAYRRALEAKRKAHASTRKLQAERQARLHQALRGAA